MTVTQSSSLLLYQLGSFQIPSNTFKWGYSPGSIRLSLSHTDGLLCWTVRSSSVLVFWIEVVATTTGQFTGSGLIPSLTWTWLNRRSYWLQVRLSWQVQKSVLFRFLKLAHAGDSTGSSRSLLRKRSHLLYPNFQRHCLKWMLYRSWKLSIK